MTATTTPPRTHRRTPAASARERTRAAAAALLLLSLLAGVPLLLATFIGNPLPHQFPNVGVLHRSLVQPLSDNAVVRVLAVVAWVAWAHLAVAVVRELRAQLRGLPSPRRLPALAFNQHLAHQLVATALLLIPAAASMHTAPVAALTRAAGDPYPTGQARPVAAVAFAADSAGHPHIDGQTAAATNCEAPALVSHMASQHASTRPHKVYVVQPPHGQHYDSLWDIAARHLGDGRRYREIYELNKGRPQPDGGELTRASLIQPGWVLLLPADATGPGVRDADSTADQTAAKPTVATPPATPPGPRPAHSHAVSPAPQIPQPAREGSRTADRKSTVSEPDPTATQPTRPGSAEHGVPITPIAVGLGLGSLAALAALQRARRSALRRRPIGHRIAPTPARLQPVEAGLRAEARHADPLAATVRLAVALARQRGLDTTVQHVIHHDNGSVALRFATSPPPAPAPFTATEVGWQLASDATRFAFAVEGNHDPLPALLQLGRHGDAEVYVDLDLAGYTAADGDEDAVNDLLATAAARLVGAPWTTQNQVMIPARLAGRVGRLDRVETVADLAARTGALLRDAVPLVCLIGWRCDELSDELVHAALDPAKPVLILAAGNDTRVQRQWQLCGDQLSGAGVDPVTVAPRPPAADQVAELIEHTCTAPDVPADDPAYVEVRTDAPPAASAALPAMSVNVLGPVELHGIEEPTPRRTPIFRTLVYLAMHRRGVTAEQLATALWPDELAAGRTVRNRIAEARALVGGAITNGPGWQLEERIGCDWQQFQALAVGSPAQQAAALDLVRGQPFDGFADEWVDVEMLRSDMIAAIIDLTVAVAERALADDDPTLAFRAARTGLRASPYEERLFRLAMQAADAEGSTGKLRALMNELQRVLDVHVAPDDRMQRETVALYEELTSATRRKERVH